MMRSKSRKRIEKRKLLAIPLIVCLAITMCFGFNFSKVFASGYVTDDLTVKIGYWGMDESTFVEKGTYNWYTLASSLPLHQVAYSFYQENKYGYNTIIDSAKGFYISDFLDFAGIERSGINSISFYTKDVNVGYFTSFSYNELFNTTRYYFEDLSGNLKPKFEDTPSEEEEPDDPSGGDQGGQGGSDDPSGGDQGGSDDPSGGGSEGGSGDTDKPDEPSTPSEPENDPSTDTEGNATNLADKFICGILWDDAIAAEKKYKLISVSDTNAWKHKKAVQPMLALEDHWESFETTSYNQPTNTEPSYSSLGTGNRFRLLFGQSSPKESKTNQTAKYVHTLYVTYTGVPEVVEDMKDINGEVGQHQISFNVSAGDSGMIQSLIDQMGWNSTNEEVLTIDKVSMSKNSKYSDVVTVNITYTIKKKGNASIKGTYAGIEIGGNAISTSEGTSDGDGSSGDGTGEGESKSGDKAKGNSKSKAGDTGSKGESIDQKGKAADVLSADNSTQVYELDESIARMLTQTSQDVVQTDKETLKVKNEENNTGPYTAAGALGLCIGGAFAEGIRFRRKL